MPLFSRGFCRFEILQPFDGPAGFGNFLLESFCFGQDGGEIGVKAPDGAQVFCQTVSRLRDADGSDAGGCSFQRVNGAECSFCILIPDSFQKEDTVFVFSEAVKVF